MDLIESFARRQARRIVRNGRSVLTAGGDPLLEQAFEHLGWDDPHEDVPVIEAAVEPAAPERAVLPRPRKR